MENKLTVNYATAWLMGVDPAATGARLKQYRNANHLTQEGLSGILTDGGDPASRVSISMWESGKKLPTLSHLVFLRELYGCTLDELICTYRQSAREAADGDQPVVFYYDLLLNAAGFMPAAFFALQSALHGVNRWYIVVFWHRQYTLTMITAGSQDSRNKAAYKLQGGTTMKKSIARMIKTASSVSPCVHRWQRDPEDRCGMLAHTTSTTSLLAARRPPTCSA